MRIDDLANAIKKEMFEYSLEVERAIDKRIDEASEMLTEELKNNPIIPEKTGKYRKSFAYKTVSKGTGYKRNKIYNKKGPLTHLLERGHAINGGTKRTKAYPHWEKAQERADKLTDEIIEKIKNVE